MPVSNGAPRSFYLVRLYICGRQFRLLTDECNVIAHILLAQAGEVWQPSKG